MSLHIQCSSDIHRDLGAARRLAAAAVGGRFDFIVVAGDIGLDGVHEPGLTTAIARAGVEVLCVPGNHDGDSAYRAEVSAAGWTNLDGAVLRRGDWWFAGVGLRAEPGSVSSPHPEAEIHIASLLDSLRDVPLDRLVVVSHLPPLGTSAARDRHFVDQGSMVLRHWLYSHTPAAIICGHVHHREPIAEQVGETRVVLGGPWGYELRLT